MSNANKILVGDSRNVTT